jgi:NADH-quinone oxidoreductase subunit G
LSDSLGKPLAFDSVRSLRERMIASNPVFKTLDQVVPAAWGAFGVEGPTTDKPLASAIDNFYMVDPISRASKTMAECTAEFGGGCGCNSKKKTGTHG